MKSLALSLLVALGVSLGSVTALADPPRPESVLAAATASMQKSQEHAQRAFQYRAASRDAAAKAQAAMQVAQNDVKYGFSYEAGVERAKAAAYQQKSQEDLVGAAREDILAAQYRDQAGREMAQYQHMTAAAAQRR